MDDKKRSRNWCWTAFEPNLNEIWLAGLGASYLCYGVETCPESKRKHWQGYMELANGKSFRAVKGIMPEGVHIESRKGSQAQAIEYCRKDGDFHELGEKAMGQGQRTDIEAVRGALAIGTSLETVADDNFRLFLQYGRGLREYHRMKQPKRDWETKVTVIWGATGTGKSKMVNEKGAVFVEYDKGGFIHGYENQAIVCFDDFDPNTMTREVFLRLTDRYHVTVNVKGGSMTWNPKEIYFTSNSSPRDWYNGDAAVGRRLKNIIHMNEPLVAIPFGSESAGMDVDYTAYM